MTAKKLKKVVNDWRGLVSIPDRPSVIRTTLFVRDLLKAAGYEDTAYFTNALANELDSMDTSEIVMERIWIG
jgi:hypothetical protein